jgi:hypothetical protein
VLHPYASQRRIGTLSLLWVGARVSAPLFVHLALSNNAARDQVVLGDSLSTAHGGITS